MSNKHIKFIPQANANLKDLLTLTYIEPEYYKYTLFRVPEEYIARPDLVALDHYGDEQYTDIICKLNGISNPFELNAGMLLVLPVFNELHLFRFDNDTIDSTDDSNAGDFKKPKPKTRKEKRQANEAVVGDARFKIDQSRRIAIY